MPEKGDIVLVAFPFTDVQGEKRRPALVVGSSTEHVILLFVTSRETGDPRWRVPVKAAQGTGLTLASAIRCDKLASLDARTVIGRLGKAKTATVKTVNAKLRRLLAL